MITVIGDVHGCAKTLEALLAKIPSDQQIVLSGDLIDRGPDSAGVVALVRARGILCVRGNHEQMMISAFIDNHRWSDFLANGGVSTIASYGLNSKADVPKQLMDDVQWMQTLPLFLEFPDIKNDAGQHLLVTHSSAHTVWEKKGEVAPDRFADQLLWNRVPNIRAIPNIFNVFGHTPHPDNPRIKSCYANLDTGCCYYDYKNEGFGVLTALQWPQMITYQQENIDS